MDVAIDPVALVFAKSGAASFVGKQTGTTTPADGTGTRIKMAARFAIQAFWTGTLTGVVSVEASINSTDGINGNWTTLTVSLHGAQPAGAPGSLLIDPITIASCWIRVRYTATSGAGNVTIWLTGRGL